MTFNHKDYPMDPYNPLIPVWLSINGREHREPHISKPDARQMGRPTIPMVIEYSTGEIITYKSKAEAHEALEFTNPDQSSGLKHAAKRADEDGWMTTMGKTLRILEGE